MRFKIQILFTHSHNVSASSLTPVINIQIRPSPVKAVCEGSGLDGGGEPEVQLWYRVPPDCAESPETMMSSCYTSVHLENL